MKRKATGRRVSIDPFADDKFSPSTPVDSRVRLPLNKREVTQTVLPNGTVLVSYDDQPTEGDEPELPPLLADADVALAEPGLSYRRDKPRPPTGDRGGRWSRLR